MKNSQGQEANHSGRSLERDIENEFISRGVQVVRWKRNKSNLDIFAERQLIKRVPQPNWFGGWSVSEFVYQSTSGISVRIECKWQEHTGSVDEKGPAMKENALLAPEPVVWMVLGGPGMRPGIRRYLYKQCMAAAESGVKIIRFLTPADTRRAIKQLVENDDPGSPFRDIPYQPPPKLVRRKVPDFSPGTLL